MQGIGLAEGKRARGKNPEHNGDARRIREVLRRHGREASADRLQQMTGIPRARILRACQEPGICRSPRTPGTFYDLVSRVEAQRSRELAKINNVAQPITHGRGARWFNEFV